MCKVYSVKGTVYSVHVQSIQCILGKGSVMGTSVLCTVYSVKYTVQWVIG